MNIRTGLFIALFLSTGILVSTNANAQEFKVEKISASKNRALLKGNLGTLKFNTPLVFKDEFGEECVGRILRTKNDQITVDISSCDNASNVKEGSIFKVGTGTVAASPTQTQPTTTQAVRTTPTIDEDWYTLWGLGFSSVRYGDDQLQDAVDNLEDTSGVDRGTINLDLLGFYWPHADKKSMSGFIINSIGDTFTGPGGDMTISQALYAYSFHHFFGANIGDGWFLRGDIGLAKFSINVDTTTLNVNDSSDWGWGVLGGGGYAFAIGTETRMLLGAYYSHRKADEDTAGTLNVTLGFLF